MTPKQKEKYNRMVETLRMISRDYMTPEQIYIMTTRPNFIGGSNYTEALEMSYKNMQEAAQSCVKGIRKIK